MTQRRRDVAERAVISTVLRVRRELGEIRNDLRYLRFPVESQVEAMNCLLHAVDHLMELAPSPIDDPAPAAGPDAPDTSRAAQRKAILHHGGYRRKVYDFLTERDHRGATDEEMEIALHLPHTSLSSARHSLMRDRWVYDSGARRQTLAKRDAIVWKARAMDKLDSFYA